MIEKLKYICDKFKQHIKFSSDVNPYELFFIHPQLMLMIGFVNNFCYENKLEFKITSVIRTKEENKRVKAVSTTHIDGRAADISLKGFSKEQVEELESEINIRFKHVGAVSPTNGESRPIVVHVGTGYHAHLQIRPNL